MPNLTTSITITLVTICAAVSANVLASQKADRITKLPRAPNVPFEQFSGHVVVDENEGRELFYWLIRAEHDADDKPLVLWFSGGPGCSSIGFGEAVEIGPFLIDEGGQSLYLNTFSWNRVANLLFLETPAGVGFSRSNSSWKGIFNDRITAKDNIAFLIRWLDRFSEYKKSDIFVTGASYAGHYATQMTQQILLYNKLHPHQPLKIRGVMVGNPELSAVDDQLGRTDYFWDHGMISSETYEGILESCMSSFETGEFTERCIEFYDVKTKKEIGEMDAYSILTDYCPSSASTAGGLLRTRYYDNAHPRNYNPCYEDLLNIYFNNLDVQIAMHATSPDTPVIWSSCNYSIYKQWSFDVLSVLPIMQEIIDAGIRLYVYSGDTDSLFPFTGTRRALASLGLPIEKKWYPWYSGHKHLGWATKYDGITFTTLRGANHQAPMLRPEAAQILFTLFLNGADPPDTP